MAYCPECYRVPVEFEALFPIRKVVDEDGQPLTVDGDGERYKCGRAGDHLMNPFQCSLCHFRNIQGRNPDLNFAPDRRFMAFVDRANLDAMWSREPATVRNNLREARRADIDYAKEFHIGSFTPEMGPFPLEDSIGMKAAILLLRRSLDKGRYEAYVQPDTFRKAQATLTNVTRASVVGLGDAIGTTERGPMSWVSDGATHTRWFGRFMVGIKRRVGEVTKQDEPISIEVLKKVEEILEERWAGTQCPDLRRSIALSGAWYMIGFCAGLRGEEMLIIELAGTRDSLEHLEEGRHPIPYFLVPINGRTKLNRDAGAKFWIPCAGTTRSGLEPGKWVMRHVSCLVASGRSGGFLFSFYPKMAGKLSQFEEHFYPLLEEVQRTTDLIDKTLVIHEAYGIWRSLRRGVTIHAINMEISEKLIRLINRWRNERGSGKSKQDMLEVYTVLIKLIPTIVKFSVGL